MKSVLILFLIIGLVLCTEIPEEEGVLVLSSSNFEEVIENNANVLVEFYAPWCGHCKALAPEYASAAQKLKDKNSNIKLAKVDATVESELASKYKVRGYPTLKLFMNGKALDFSGGRTADTIVSWLEKKLGPPAIILESLSQIKAFIDSHDVVVVGFFSDLTSTGYKAFESVAASTDSAVFGFTSEKSLFDEYKVIGKENIVLFKKFDDGRNDFSGNLEEVEIKQFIEKYELPIIIEFNQETAQKIFSGTVKTHCLAFFGKTIENFNELKKNFEDVAKKYLGKVLFVLVNIDEEDNERVLEFFGMTKADTPSFRVIKVEGEMVKFKPDDVSVTSANIESFVQSVLDGKVKAHLMSQEVPEDWDKGSVKVLVGKNFDSVARDKSKNVFVEFYAPWCGHCKQLAPIWDQLGDLYSSSADIVVAKMDSTLNEVEGIRVHSFPTLKYFPKGSDDVIEYGGDRSLDALKRFLDSDGKEGAKDNSTDDAKAEEDEPDLEEEGTGADNEGKLKEEL